MQTNREIPKKITDLLHIWDKLFHRWWVYHYVLSIAGIIASITVASNPKFLSGYYPEMFSIFAWLSALCMTLVTFLMPSRRARAYVAAWRLLFDACSRYELEDTYSMKELLDTVKKGEDIIS
mgnify:CR=1 FL=1